MERVVSLMEDAIETLNQAIIILDQEVEMSITERNRIYTVRRHLLQYIKQWRNHEQT